MRSIKRQVQHGPTCRSILILVIGLAIISVCSRPRSHYHFKIGRGSKGDDDLRQVISRTERKTPTQFEMKFQEATVVSEETSATKLDDDVQQEKVVAVNGSNAAGIHVMLTSNGSPYMNWQTRIMYYTYLQVASMPGSDFKHFTRVLHRSTDDALVDDIPTVRVEPLDPKCDQWCDYPVASRPWAIWQWLDSGDVKGDWIFMIETDYVFVTPLGIPSSGRAVGFPFGYITPQQPSLKHVIRKFYPEGDLANIPGTGNAPVLILSTDLRRIVPRWVRITASIEADETAKNAFGWVREMYAFSIATALEKVPIDLPPMPGAIMSQPPADEVIGSASILHYTWGSFIKDDAGKILWEFEKRKFTDRGLPDRIPDVPEGKQLSEAQQFLIAKVNEAIDNLPKYTLRELHEMGKSEGEIETILREDRERVEKRSKRSSVKLQDVGVTPNSIHVMATSNGNPYMNWQTRLMYHSWKKVSRETGNDMMFFTRVLHRMKADELMDEIPTVRVDPLDPKCDVWCDYPVASRPWAIQQWLDSGDLKGDWIFMIETDYLFVKPVSIPQSGRALGFLFGYIIPTWPTITQVMSRFYPGDLKDVPQTGNAPVLAKAEDLRRVVPAWVDVTAKIEADAEAKEKLGWVREMYAFSIAAAIGKMPIDLPLVPHSIMVQPPADSVLGDAAIIHYTWGSQLKNEKGDIVWEWDKRKWTGAGDLPPHIPDPPAELASELQKLMVKVLNSGIDDLWGSRN